MNIRIKEKDYTFICDYKENETLRQSFNELTNKTWEFDFEPWFESGYWGGNCHLYSLMDGDRMVSHITITTFDGVIFGKQKRLAQLGTVMTDEAYRKLGLNQFLMEKVLEEWKDKCDFIYLFANESVLDFYPKFGFAPVYEYEAVKAISNRIANANVRKMDVDEISDLHLLDRIGRSAIPLFDLSIVNNIGGIAFYCKALDIFKNNLYYLGDLDAIAVAEYEGENLIIHDVLTAKNIDIDVVIESLAASEVQNVILRFMPINKKGYSVRQFKDEDLTLFVSSESKELFEENRLIFPVLSHT